ncbi:hypothetical protein ACIA74_45275, partial [Streptomyces sp. NPDC051658]|uniref:hypothetical protein n=1 Tax=Streptomyces sp. NPDC051658 TaxID=3365667 RepID=UPI003796E97E
MSSASSSEIRRSANRELSSAAVSRSRSERFSVFSSWTLWVRAVCSVMIRTTSCSCQGLLRSRTCPS